MQKNTMESAALGEKVKNEDVGEKIGLKLHLFLVFSTSAVGRMRMFSRVGSGQYLPDCAIL